jgi:hypothetical protein
MKDDLKKPDILLVREKDGDELKAVKTDSDGKVKTAKPENGENPDLMKFDRNGNVLENFFENFMRQTKNPTRFEFFRVPLENLNAVVQKLQDALKNPDTPENKQFIDLHRVNPDDFMKKQAQEQTPEKNHAIDPNLVAWDKLENFGITRETLEKSGNFDKLLDYRKTDLLRIEFNLGDEMKYTDARFSLRKQEDGSFSPHAHLIRHKPELERPYFGVTFTNEDKINLLQTGNLGRIVEAEYQKGVKTPILLSLDRLTNELVAFRTDRLKVPETIKSIQLSDLQKKELAEGKEVRIENMIGKDGEPFNARVQFNADKRSFDFFFDNNKANLRVRPNQDNAPKDVPKTFRKKELTEAQRDSLREGKTVYVDGLTDSKGKPYRGYITLNKETAKNDFMFPKDYREALAAGKVIPDDRHKTQVAVNSDGKTNEATKDVKEPLGKGQTQPTEKQAEKQAEKQEEKQAKKKSKGVNM